MPSSGPSNDELRALHEVAVTDSTPVAVANDEAVTDPTPVAVANEEAVTDPTPVAVANPLSNPCGRAPPRDAGPSTNKSTVFA